MIVSPLEEVIEHRDDITVSLSSFTIITPMAGSSTILLMVTKLPSALYHMHHFFESLRASASSPE